MHFWERTKRNHGLEHGTISLLLAQLPTTRSMAGYSIPTGFFVLGSVETDAVRTCAEEALARMKGGEADLAVSPFCGTNIVVGAGLATLGTAAALRLGGRGLQGLSRAFSNAILAIVASRPLGRMVQRRYTTSADLADVGIDRITKYRLGKLTVHWVATVFNR